MPTLMTSFFVCSLKAPDDAELLAGGVVDIVTDATWPSVVSFGGVDSAWRSLRSKNS